MTGVHGLLVKLNLWWKKQATPFLFHWTINVTDGIKDVMKGFEKLGFKTLSDQNSNQVANDLLPAFNIDPDTCKIEHIRICYLPDSICSTLMQWDDPKSEKKGSELKNAMTISVDDVGYTLEVAKKAGFTTKPPEVRKFPIFGKTMVGTIYVEPESAPVEVCCFSRGRVIAEEVTQRNDQDGEEKREEI